MCSGNDKIVVIEVENVIELHEQLRIKVKRRGSKKPVRELKVGDDLHRKSGKWHYREMYIDRERDWYREVVRDKVTGKIVHLCEELLSKHRGHGSARGK